MDPNITLYVVVTRDGVQTKVPVDSNMEIPDNILLFRNPALRVQYQLVQTIKKICDEGPFDAMMIVANTFSNEEVAREFINAYEEQIRNWEGLVGGTAGISIL